MQALQAAQGCMTIDGRPGHLRPLADGAMATVVRLSLILRHQMLTRLRRIAWQYSQSLTGMNPTGLRVTCPCSSSEGRSTTAGLEGQARIGLPASCQTDGRCVCPGAGHGQAPAQQTTPQFAGYQVATTISEGLHLDYDKFRTTPVLLPARQCRATALDHFCGKSPSLYSLEFVSSRRIAVGSTELLFQA